MLHHFPEKLADPYDAKNVYVKESGVPFAGEGLYARRYLKAGDLVCLFNGVRCHKEGRAIIIKADSDEWSDYRLTLSKKAEFCFV